MKYLRRRDNFESQLQRAHLPFVHSKGGIYIWLHTPQVMIVKHSNSCY